MLKRAYSYIQLLAVFFLLRSGQSAFLQVNKQHVSPLVTLQKRRTLQDRTRPVLLSKGDGGGSASDFLVKLPEDVGGSLTELVTPLATELDTIANEDDGNSLKSWVFSYADLSPDNERTPAGAAFLATNLAYALAGVWLNVQGDVALGLGSELASVASFSYHYSQLAMGPKQPLVRVALLVDYIFAFAAVGIAADYLWTTSSGVPTDTFVVLAAALGCFAASWIKEGTSYLVFHGLWHVLGAYGGFLLGEAHLGLA